MFVTIVERWKCRENTAGLQSRAGPYTGTLAQFRRIALRRAEAREGKLEPHHIRRATHAFEA
jgi:hypothetical protein